MNINEMEAGKHYLLTEIIDENVEEVVVISCTEVTEDGSHVCDDIIMIFNIENSVTESHNWIFEAAYDIGDYRVVTLEEVSETTHPELYL